MLKNNKYFFMLRILVLLYSGLMIASVQAAQPLWTISPAPGSNPIQTVPENGVATTLYVVHNQSNRPKQLVMQSMPGITQTAPCHLAPRGQVGSSCILNIAIMGSRLPNGGVHGGPVLCQANRDGSPNSNQCYQPSSANSLHITRGSASSATIIVTPSNLNFVAGNNGWVTVTNSMTSLESAENVAATIPGGSSIGVQSTTCGAILAIGASCTITFTAPTTEGPTNIGISGSNTNTVHVAVAVTPIPMATISVNPTTLVFVENSTRVVTITNSTSSLEPAENVIATIPLGSNISVQSTTCDASLAIGTSCTITFTAPAAEGPTNIGISGSNTNTAQVTVTVTPIPMATISVNPTTLVFAENSTGSVTVTNDAASTVEADNVAETIPSGSNISVQSTTCDASLAIGTSCMITFVSSTQEGPTAIPIKGDNTNIVNVDVTVTSQPQISITNPAQQDRVVNVSGTALSLQVTNNASSAANANAITISNHASCPDLSVNDSNCASVAPGNSCTLQITSNTAYVPCTITVSGSNTVNSPTTPIAFFHLGGLVFVESNGTGKVVTGPLNTPERTSQWSSSVFNNISTTNSDGAQNTTNIIAYDDGCTSVETCAARRCRNNGPDWYLPALDELRSVAAVLCPGGTACNFGSFLSVYYWCSSQVDSGNAYDVRFPTGSLGFINKNGGVRVRCVRTFTP